MKYDLLALLAGTPDLTAHQIFKAVQASNYTAVFAPVRSGAGFGNALRRNRLRAAPERQAWLESLMPHGPVLPFAPGAYLDPDLAEDMVVTNRRMLDDLTDRLTHKVQYQITVSWAEDRVLDHFRDAPEIAPLFQSGRVTPNALAGAVARLSDRLSTVISAKLSSVVSDFAELPRDTGMVSNSVVLIDASDELILDAVLEAIDALWSDGFRIRQIGPSPATSFATLRPQRHSQRDLRAAFRRLGLQPSASSAAIRESRQQLLRDAGAQVEAIRTAARLAEAAADLGGTDRGAVLLSIWSEGRSAQPGLDNVA